VTKSLEEHGFNKNTAVSVGFYCECVSLKNISNGLEQSALHLVDSMGESLSLKFNGDLAEDLMQA